MNNVEFKQKHLVVLLLLWLIVWPIELLKAQSIPDSLFAGCSNLNRFYHGCMYLHKGAETDSAFYYRMALDSLKTQGQGQLLNIASLSITVADSSVLVSTKDHMHFNDRYAKKQWRKANGTVKLGDGQMRDVTVTNKCRTVEYGLRASATLEVIDRVKHHCILVVIAEYGATIEVEVHRENGEQLKAEAYDAGAVAFVRWNEPETSVPVRYFIRNTSGKDISLVLGTN